jgi:hypothetical protein
LTTIVPEGAAASVLKTMVRSSAAASGGGGCEGGGGIGPAEEAAAEAQAALRFGVVPDSLVLIFTVPLFAAALSVEWTTIVLPSIVPPRKAEDRSVPFCGALEGPLTPDKAAVSDGRRVPPAACWSPGLSISLRTPWHT